MIDVASWFTQYAFQPEMVYIGIFVFMLLSSFGLPIPEEIVLITTALLTHIAQNESMNQALGIPIGESRLKVDILIMVFMFSVVFTDFVIYILGRSFGPKILNKMVYLKLVKQRNINKVQKLIDKYGAWMVCVFRFVPGFRFVVHISCGAFRISVWKFMLADILVVIISIPSQILLIYFYGEEMIYYLSKFKITIIGVLITLGTFWILKVLFNKFLRPRF